MGGARGALVLTGAMLRRTLPAIAAALLVAAPACAQELPVGQSEADYRAWLAVQPRQSGQILSFEAWQQAAGVENVLPTWQLVRTARMWRECGGARSRCRRSGSGRGWSGRCASSATMSAPAVGPVEAVSGYRNPALNACARGSERSAHLDFFALDLIPVQPATRRQLFERLCPMHDRWAGGGSGARLLRLHPLPYRHAQLPPLGLGAGPRGNESPCDVLARGEDPEAPPLPPPRWCRRGDSHK